MNDSISTAISNSSLGELRRLSSSLLSSTPTGPREIREPKRFTVSDTDTRRKSSLKVRFSSPGTEGSGRRLKSPSPDLRPSPLHTRSTESARLPAGLNRQRSFEISPRQDDRSSVREDLSNRPLMRQHSRNARSETATPLPTSRGRNRRTATVEEVSTSQPLASPVLQRESTLTSSRRARTENTRLKGASSISSPLATKRVTRRPQHYESDTFSTLTRKRHVITKHPTLRETPAPSFELPRTTPRPAPLRPVQPARTVVASAAPVGTATTMPSRRKTRTPATATTTTTVEKTVTRPRTRAKRSATVHGICCWNSVCDCVLVDILRSQPLVTLFEKKRKKIKILINPDANENFTAVEVEEPTPRRTRRGRPAAVESNAAEC